MNKKKVFICIWWIQHTVIHKLFPFTKHPWSQNTLFLDMKLVIQKYNSTSFKAFSYLLSVYLIETKVHSWTWREKLWFLKFSNSMRMCFSAIMDYLGKNNTIFCSKGSWENYITSVSWQNNNNNNNLKFQGWHIKK